ncbi:hypothetical protein [Ruminococcus albus]|uniref:SipW-cognate class signal peptide n=1 Tax=Ruminococcus albus 8 TaxID=246199 RepID=E9SFT8_RUMAL|nr:hypothetical protein [Ruminococcus albus]EGC01783.1 hypothetical protein CUS_7887 [Ruminococcus albus 8]MCC3352804.1 hypothetical protein [Ruminococcus albus 8]
MKANTKKKGNPMKKLVPAAGMLAISATMLATSTYAWFTMNKEVTVQNLAVQAKAEGGLLISETQGYAATDIWDDSANTTAELAAAKVALYPTSTANTGTWYHATSKTANDAANAEAGSASTYKNDGYTALTLTSSELQAAAAGTNGKKDVYFADSGTSGYDADDAKYYLKYTYYLKTSTEGTTTLGLANGDQNLNISVVNVTGSSVSTELNKSLRVGIEIGGKFYIFAPVSGATGTYYVNASSTATNAIDSSASTHDAPMTVATGLTSLPGVKQNGTPVYVYMWYEGEDAACKSENVTATLDELTVNLEFKLTTLSAAATDSGVAVPTP